MSARSVRILAPPVFVLMWSTGFIVARSVAGQIGPLTFLTWRFVLAALVLALLSVVTGARWPRGIAAWRDLAVAGLLIQAAYLGGIFWAVSRGLPSGIAALIAGLQPLLTALVSWPLLRERVSAQRWTGIVIGFAGVALVIAPRLQPGDAIPIVTFVVALGATVAITFGSILQKRIGGGLDVLPLTAVQYLASVPPAALATWLMHEPDFAWTPSLAIATAWSVLGNSVGAVCLFLWLIRQGALVAVSTLLFLVPPTTAVMGFVLFGETLHPIQLGGMALAAVGVSLASR